MSSAPAIYVDNEKGVDSNQYGFRVGFIIGLILLISFIFLRYYFFLYAP